MGKLRHIALYADDIETTAGFYEQSFGMQRVRQVSNVITLTDGVVSLAIADAKLSKNGHKGLDHFGFVVDDMDAAVVKLEASGGVHCGQISRTHADANIERKYRGPDGVVFDIATPGHARPVWGIPV